MSCIIPAIENRFRQTNPELADKLNAQTFDTWNTLIDSKLFQEKDDELYVNKEGTKKRVKQNELIATINNNQSIVQITEDNKVSVDLLRGVSEQQETNEPYLQLASDLINPAIEELDNYLLDFLKGFNVKFKEFEELKSRLGVNALGATDVLNKLIWYVKNRNEETLPEEAAHMIVALMGEKNPDIIELLANIKNWSEYEAIKNEYLPIYNDENKVKIEAVGKLIAKSLVKNYKAVGLDKNKLQKILDNIINFIEDILSSLSFNNVFMYNESVADHIAINVLSGNKDYIYKIKNLNPNLNAIQEINNNPHAKNIISTFSSNNVKMTGSLAIAGTENVRRPEGKGIHDIDFKVKSFKIFENEVESKIPSNAVPLHYGWHKKQYSTFSYLVPLEGYTIKVIERKDDYSNGLITQYELYNEKNEQVEITQLNLMTVDFFVYKEGSNQKDFDYSTEFIPASLVYEGKMTLGGKSNPYFFSRDKDQEDYVLRNPKSFIPFEKYVYYQLADESSSQTIKPGVEELFDSNPELANEVYEALGFNKQINFDVEEILIVDKNEIPKKDGESFSEMQKRVTQNINIRKRIEIADKNNIIQGKSYSYSEIKKLFNNDNLFTNEIYNQLSIVLQSSNLSFKFGSLNQGKKTTNAYYNSISNSINIDTLVLQTPNLATSDFKRILLHEIIHAATFINLKENAILTSTQKTALNNLNNLIVELNKDKDFFAQYGLTNANELLAELANEQFVDKLKNKKFNDNQSFFDKIISEIVKLLGLKTTAYDIVKESFDNLVKDYKSNSQITPEQKQQALQLYSQYIDSIFPDSQVKDIVYHRSNQKFEKFDNSKLNQLTGGFFDFAKESGLENYGKNLYSVLLNIKKLGAGFLLKNGEDGLQSTEMIFNGKDIYSVPDASQIHILGNKEDIEGFKDFVENTTDLENDMFLFQQRSVSDLLQEIVSNRDISKAENILDKLSSKFNIPWQWSTDPNEKGSIKNGVVYINKDLFTEDTLFHEFAHPFVEYLALNNPTVYKILASNSAKVVNAQTGRTVKEEIESKYGDYSQEDLEKEIITEAIGLAAIDQLTEENRPLFLSILDRFLNFISQLFGFNVTLNTTFKEIADTIFDDTYNQDLAPYLQGNYFQRDNSLTRDQIEDRFREWTNRFELDPIEHKYKDSLTDEILDSVSTVVIQPLYDAKGSKLKTDIKSVTEYAYGAVFGTAEHNIIQFFIDQNLNDDKSIKDDKFYDVDLLKANNLHIVDTITSDTNIPVKGVINDDIIQQSLQFVDNYLNFVQETYGEDVHIWTEQMVYDTSYPINKGKRSPLIGTADIIIVMNDGSYVVHDWKTTESKYGNRPKEALQDIKKQAYKEQIGTYGKMIGGNFKGGIVYPIGANKGYNNLTKLPLFPQELEFPQPDPLKADPTNFFLYPVTVSGDEKVIENSLEELIEKLRFLQKKIMNREYSLNEEEEYYDRKKSSDEIERAVEDLETRKSFYSIVRYGLDLQNEIEDLLDNMTLDQVEKAQEQIIVYLQLPSYGEYLDLKETDLDKLDAFKAKTDRLIAKLDIKRTQLLTKQGEAEGITQLNNAEKKYNVLGRLFKGMSGISDIKTLALFHKLKSKLYNIADRRTKNDLSVIDKLEKDLKEYGSKNGLNILKVYHKFLRKDSNGKLIPKLVKRVKDEFYEDIYNAIVDNNPVKLSQYFDLVEYNSKLQEAIENYKVKYQDISERREFFPEEIAAFRNRVQSTDTDEALIKQMRLDYYNKQLMKFVNNRTLIQNGKINQQAVNHLFRIKDNKVYIKDHIISYKESKIKDYYTSEYNEILNNPALKSFYEFIIEQNENAYELNLIDYAQIYSFIPSVIASTVEQAERGDLGYLSTVDKLKKSVDIEFIDENTISKVVINPITNEPEYEVQKLMQNNLSVERDGVKDYSNYSLDLGYVYALYSMEIHNYSAKLDLAPVGEALINMEKTKSTVKSNKWGNVVKDDKGNVIIEKLGPGSINDTNINFVKESIERDVYGVTDKTKRDIAIPFFKFFDEKGKFKISIGKISGNKLLRGAVAFNSHTNLGLNTLSALGTYFGGSVNAYFEANRSDQMSKKDLIKAGNASASIFSNSLMGNKHLTLINLLDPMMENENLNRAILLSSTKLRKILNVNMLYEFMRRADRAVQYNVALAVSMNYMIVNDELVNINEYIRANQKLNGKTYSQLLKEGDVNSINQIRKEIEKEVLLAKETKSVYVLSNMKGDNLDTPLTDDHVDKLRTIIKKQNSQIIGNMSQRDKMGLKNYALGEAALQYRNWMPALLQQRFGSAEMDNDLNRLNWGKMRTTFHALVNKDILSMTKSLFFDINDIALGRIRSKYEELLQDHLDKGGTESSFETYENFVEYYIANVRSSLKELSMLLSLAMLFSALASAMGWDDDDKKKSGAQKTSYKIYSKLMSELTFFYSPSQQASIFGNVLPVMNTLSNVGKLSTSLVAESWYNTKQGIFDIDEKRNLRENAPTKYAFKLPVLKEATTWMAMFNDDFRKEYNITVQYK